MTELTAYMCGLFAVLALVAVTVARHREQAEQMLRTAAAILLNWLVGVSYVAVTHDYTPWAFNIFIDTAAAVAVMYRPAGQVQGFIGLFYFCQIASHTAFGLRGFFGLPVDRVFYYDSITWIAWAQLAAMGGWGGAIMVGDFVHRMRRRGDASRNRARAANSQAAP